MRAQRARVMAARTLWSGRPVSLERKEPIGKTVSSRYRWNSVKTTHPSRQSVSRFLVSGASFFAQHLIVDTPLQCFLLGAIAFFVDVLTDLSHIFCFNPCCILAMQANSCPLSFIPMSIHREPFVCPFWTKKRAGVQRLLSSKFWSESRICWMIPIQIVLLSRKHTNCSLTTRRSTEEEFNKRRGKTRLLERAESEWHWTLSEWQQQTTIGVSVQQMLRVLCFSWVASKIVEDRFLYDVMHLSGRETSDGTVAGFIF